MGRSVPVKIGQKEYESKTAAVSYYMNQRTDVKAAGIISEGDYFEELKELFSLYRCLSITRLRWHFASWLSRMMNCLNTC